jgi:N-acetylglucosaminyldiphosphoundecaprenol N-acetyl-beta-D-mannosaminyltransferase
MKKLPIFHTTFNIAPYQTFVDQIIDKSRNAVGGKYVCVANVHMLIEAYKDDDFAQQVRNADIVTPDGMPITWAIRLIHGLKQDRVAGMDLLPDLLKRAEAEKLPVYFYGGTEEMLEKTATYTAKHYPTLQVAGLYSPPFHSLTTREDQEVIKNINASGAKLVFVVLGCPKQEKWMASMKSRIDATMIGIGGALPVLLGMQKRAPLWMQSSGLEWCYRLVQDPKRLWKRYFVTNSIFLGLIIGDRMKRAWSHQPWFVKKESFIN